MSAAVRLGFKAIPDPHIPPQLKQEVGNVVMDIIRNYKVNASSSREESLQEAWDYVQAQVRRAGGDTWVVHIRSLMSAHEDVRLCCLWGRNTSASAPPPQHSLGDSPWLTAEARRQPRIQLLCACLERPLLATTDLSLGAQDGPKEVRIDTSPSHLIPKGTHR